MALYNFQKRFAPAIEAGAKRHTIRAKRKCPTKVGEELYLYTGLRQTGARKLRLPEDEVPHCTKVQDIQIDWGIAYSVALCSEVLYRSVRIDGQLLDLDECESLAMADGFKDFEEMMQFWPDNRLPFEGDIIHW